MHVCVNATNHNVCFVLCGEREFGATLTINWNTQTKDKLTTYKKYKLNRPNPPVSFLPLSLYFPSSLHKNNTGQKANQCGSDINYTGFSGFHYELFDEWTVAATATIAAINIVATTNFIPNFRRFWHHQTMFSNYDMCAMCIVQYTCIYECIDDPIALILWCKSNHGRSCKVFCSYSGR